MPKIGAHVSAAGGLYNCFENADQIGAESIQIFGSSPRTWATRELDKKDIEKYKNAQKEYKIGPVYLHAAYLVNLGSDTTETRKKSIQSLVDHLTIAEQIGARGLVFHMGSGTGKVKDLTIKGMQQVLDKVPGKSFLIMENSSGGGNKYGSQLEDLAEIASGLKSERVRVCLDTAHAFEAGILRYEKKEITSFFDKFDELIGLDLLDLLHVNDSKTEFQSNTDRHENIGEGYIGLAGFRNLTKEKRLRKLPWILEVPGFSGEGVDKKNLKLLHSAF